MREMLSISKEQKNGEFLPLIRLKIKLASRSVPLELQRPPVLGLVLEVVGGVY